MEEKPVEESLKPAEFFIIKDLDTLRAISDPLRLKIVESVVSEPCTVKQIAKSLKVAPTKVYYHINQLEEHGVIRVVSTRVVSGIIEKQYQAVATNFQVDSNLLSLLDSSSAEQEINALISPVFDNTKAEIIKGIQAGQLKLAEGEPRPGHRKLILYRALNQFSPDQVNEFYNRLEALVNEFQTTRPENKKEPSFAMLVALYPLPSQNDEEGDEPAE